MIGTPRAPAILDVRTGDDFAGNQALIPGAVRRAWADVAQWARQYRGQQVIVTCRAGHGVSQGAAAWLRQSGAEAEALDGGLEAWTDAGLPLVPQSALPALDAEGRTVWVTRARPKVDRIACPWLIRRFVDRSAVFLFVPSSEVASVAKRYSATPFDVEGENIMRVFPEEFSLPRDYEALEARFLSFSKALNVRPSVLDAVIWSEIRKTQSR